MSSRAEKNQTKAPLVECPELKPLVECPELKPLGECPELKPLADATDDVQTIEDVIAQIEARGGFASTEGVPTIADVVADLGLVERIERKQLQSSRKRGGFKLI